MKVTKTLINPGNSDLNYVASQEVAGSPKPVITIQPTRIAAIAVCILKVEAQVSMMKRREKNQGSTALRIPVACGC